MNAGQWRRVNARISGSKYSPQRVEKLISLLKKWEQHYVEMEMNCQDVFSQVSEIHFGFESIHPFSDRNGRAGRLLLNIHFLNHNWPLVCIHPHDRNGYPDALEFAHHNSTDRLTEFLKTNMASSLIFMLGMIGSEDDNLLTLDEAKKTSDTNYSTKYLALKIKQEGLPGIRLSNMWKTSPVSIGLYRE